MTGMLVFSLTTVLCGSTLSAEPRPDVPWYRRALVGIEIGPTGANTQDPRFMARATGKEIVQNLVRAHAEYGVVFMKDMEFAYYDSAVARKCPGLGERDLLRECLDEAKPHGLPIVAYCQIQYDDSSWRQHPEWRMKDSSGKDIPGRLCYNSGYLEFIKQVAGEMMQYEIRGFHFDMLDFGFGPPYGCWCACCRGLFRNEYGMDMPPGVTWDEAWEHMLKFRCDSNTRFCRELQAFVEAARPDISVDFNYHGYPPFTWQPGELPVQHAANGHFVTAEGLPWVFGHNNPSLLALFMCGARPQGPVQGVSSCSVYDYHDFTVRPTAEMRWEVMTYLAHGAQCTIVDKAYYDGTFDPLVYERLSEVYSEAQRKREFFGHPPVAEVGLYYSSRSRDWYGRENPAKYLAAFWGAHKALLQAHIPMGFVMDESVSPERMKVFPVVYLPGVAILTPQEVEFLEAYVAGGGNLIVTGLTGLYDRYGQLQNKNSLEPLLGARLVQPYLDRPDYYVRMRGTVASEEARDLWRDIPADWPMLVWGPVVGCEAAGAQAYGEIMAPYSTPPSQWSAHMSPEKAVAPAVFIHQHGKGKVVYLPFAVDTAGVGEYRMPEQRNLLRNAVRYLNPKPTVNVEAPPNVEIVVTRDDARHRLLIHLLAFSAPATFAAANFTEGRRVLPPQMEQPMRYEASIAVGTPFSKAAAWGPNSKITRSAGKIRLTTETIHEVVVLTLR
jgi:hypothetical protein